MRNILKDKAWQEISSLLQNAISTRAPKEIVEVKNYFSLGRKFSSADFNIKQKYGFRIEKELQREPIQPPVLNPFQAQSKDMYLDMLTDSGTSTLTPDQINFKDWYLHTVSPIEINAYAGLTPKIHLNSVVGRLFGEQFSFYLTVQGRAAEKLLLGALRASGAIKQRQSVVSNRPFDTTKGQILNNGLTVEALTSMANPDIYANSKNAFIGNLDQNLLNKYTDKNHNVTLLTLTDNGSGGQPVSMANVKKVAEFAKKHNKILWIDACRIFENATFIKAFEKEYQNWPIADIVKEIVSYGDILTISFKKNYSHGGGGVLINNKSTILTEKLSIIDSSIKKQTTVDYGNGFNSYSGITGEQMIEIISGLMCAANESVVARRIAQVGYVGAYLRQFYGLPIVSGGHALYIASDHILKNVALENCPAEYLNAILMNALRVRGCGLGYIVYGKRKNGKILTGDLSMDSLRMAIPRETYTNDQLLSRLSIFGKAHKQGIFKNLKGGLVPVDYVDDGFYHFGAKYQVVDPREFGEVVERVRGLASDL